MDNIRRYNRVRVDKHADEYDCTIQIDGNHYPAMLINISQGGAQLKLDDFPGHDIHGMSGNIIDDYYEEPYLAGKYYTVAWHNDQYLGVSFLEPLEKDFDSLYAYYTT
jgi:hypothetical protein